MFLLAQSNLTVHQQTSYQTSCRKYKIQDLRRVAINALNFKNLRKNHRKRDKCGITDGHF